MDMKLPAVAAPRLVRTYLAPSYNTGNEQIYALSVLSAYLGEGETSKLYKKLVLDKKRLLAVSVSYDYSSRSYGTFSITAVPAEGVAPKAFEKKLDEAVAQALKEINDEELSKTKQKMLAGLVYLRDNPEDAAYIAGMMAAWLVLVRQKSTMLIRKFRRLVLLTSKMRRQNCLRPLQSAVGCCR